MSIRFLELSMDPLNANNGWMIGLFIPPHNWCELTFGGKYNNTSQRTYIRPSSNLYRKKPRLFLKSSLLSIKIIME